MITQHNKKFESGLVTFKMAHNFFSDLTKNEKEMLGCFKLGQRQQRSLNQSGNSVKTMLERDDPLPSEVDLRNRLPPIKNQKGCGYEK